MKKILSFIVTFLIVLFISSCDLFFPLRTNTKEFQILTSSITPQANTILLSEIETNSSLVSYDKDTGKIILKNNANSKALDGLSANNSILGAISDNSPEGFLRKITNLQVNDNEIILDTNEENIENAFSSFNINFSSGLGAEYVTQKNLAKGVHLDKVEKVDANSILQRPSITKDMTLNKFKFDIAESLEIDGIKVGISGSFEWIPVLDMTLDIIEMKYSCLLTSKTVFKIEASIGVSASPKDFEYKLTEVPISIPIMVGPVPVMCTIDLVASISFNSSIEAKAGIESFSSIITGVNLDIKNNIEELVYTNNEKYASATPPEFAFTGELKFAIGPKFTAKVAGIIGPYVSIKAYMEGEGTLSEPITIMSDSSKIEIKIGWGASTEIGGTIGFWKIKRDIKLTKESELIFRMTNQLGF